MRSSEPGRHPRGEPGDCESSPSFAWKPREDRTGSRDHPATPQLRLRIAMSCNHAGGMMKSPHACARSPSTAGMARCIRRSTAADWVMAGTGATSPGRISCKPHTAMGLAEDPLSRGFPGSEAAHASLAEISRPDSMSRGRMSRRPDGRHRAKRGALALGRTHSIGASVRWSDAM